MPLLLKRLQTALAKTTITVTSDTSPRLVRQLRSAKLEAAFIALPTSTMELDVVKLEQVPMIVAIASTDPLARRRRIRLSDLATRRLFWFPRARQPAFYDRCEDVFARHDFEPSRVLEPTDHHVLLADVAAGRGFALLPASFTKLRRDGVRYLTLAEGQDFAVGIGLVTHAENAELRGLLSDLHANVRK
jgi:DNA-binding transcriptional LysR family regulator